MPETIAVKDSILQSTKKLLGFDREFTAFDLDITTHINSAFSTLYQAGVGPVEGFMIEDENASWFQFIGNKMEINDVKTYIYLRVRMLFDPPVSSFGLEAVQKQIDELIWRLNVADDFSILYPGTPEIPGPVQGRASVWDLTGLADFPPEAPVDSVGINFITGEIFRKTV